MEWPLWFFTRFLVQSLRAIKIFPRLFLRQWYTHSKSYRALMTDDCASLISEPEYCRTILCCLNMRRLAPKNELAEGMLGVSTELLNAHSVIMYVAPTRFFCWRPPHAQYIKPLTSDSQSAQTSIWEIFPHLPWLVMMWGIMFWSTNCRMVCSDKPPIGCAHSLMMSISTGALGNKAGGGCHIWILPRSTTYPTTP